MVQARWSGVCFSTEPVDGTNKMLIEYEEGVGGVVDGTGDSEMLLLDKDEFSLPWSTLAIINNGLEVVWHEANRLENNYRRPVDIEWAIGDDGQTYILQVRPITVLKETVNAQ